MSIIEPSKSNPDQPKKVKTYPATIRIWHWANLFIISGSLITVLLNSTLTNRHKNAQIIKTELIKSGATVTDDQSASVAHALSDQTWEVHTYFGYALAALFLFRIILELFQLNDQKLLRKLKVAYNQFKTTQKNRQIAKHELTVKLIYLAFYILLTIMVITGLFLAFENLLVPFKAFRHSVKEVHGFCMYLILAFITIHLAGVYLAEKKDGKGIVSDMINGGGEPLK